MAASMTPGILDAKEKIIDHMEDMFHKNLKSFTLDVKTKMRSVSREAAVLVFELALLFMTQALPDLGDFFRGETMELRKDFKELEKTLSQKLKEAQEHFSEKLEDAQQTLCEKLEDAEKTLSEKFHAQQTFCEKLEDAQNSLLEKFDAQQTFCEKLEDDQHLFFEKLENAQLNLSKKFSEVQEKASSFQHKVENDLDKISKTTAVTTPSTTKASASAAATPCGPPKSLSQRSTFSSRAPCDTEVPQILDTKLLPGGLVVLSDYNNKCVKLYNWQGRHIHTQALDSIPWSMTVMDIRSQTSWDLYVTLPYTKKIYFMGVTPNRVNIKTSIHTTKQYGAIAAVTTQTLAVGYSSGPGIDLIDLSGRILRQLNSTLYPLSMVTTPDGFLMVTTRTDNSVVKINLEDETIVFRRKVEQIKNPRGIAYTMDGSLIVTDSSMHTLHLIGPDASWLKKLWTHPGGQDARDELLSVSVLEQTCICCTRRGSVFVTDVSY